jgi:hypothetical protein
VMLARSSSSSLLVSKGIRQTTSGSLPFFFMIVVDPPIACNSGIFSRVALPAVLPAARGPSISYLGLRIPFLNSMPVLLIFNTFRAPTAGRGAPSAYFYFIVSPWNAASAASMLFWKSPVRGSAGTEIPRRGENESNLGIEIIHLAHDLISCWGNFCFSPFSASAPRNSDSKS